MDFAGLINHYPDLSLQGNMPERTKESIERIASMLDKAALYGCDGAVFCSEMKTESAYFPERQMKEGLLRSWEAIKALCAERGITFYLQNRHWIMFPNSEVMRHTEHYAINLPLRAPDGTCPLADDFARAVKRGIPVALLNYQSCHRPCKPQNKSSGLLFFFPHKP